jgi:chemotaxis family two-component system response regulator PixG
MQIGKKEISRVWEYLVLTILVKRRWIQREQAVALIEYTSTEILFDIFQGARGADLRVRTSNIEENLGEPFAIISAEQAFAKAQQHWKAWFDADLAPYSPNWAPILQQPEELRKRLSVDAYLQLEKAIDGNVTLRDIAGDLQQDLLLLTRLLVTYINKGWIVLQEVPDLLQPDPLFQGEFSKPTLSQRTPSDRRFLIACVDDSVQVCQAMAQILTTAGYGFISIQDSLQALPTLLEQKPDLIFLDLVMPIANGYEICAQIRRVSALKNTPVVILTGNDGIIDRVRAKVVGASDFLAKPIEPNKVLHIVQRYLLTNTRVYSRQEATPNFT